MRITTATKTHIKTSVRITPARIPIRGVKSVSSSSAEKVIIIIYELACNYSTHTTKIIID